MRKPPKMAGGPSRKRCNVRSQSGSFHLWQFAADTKPTRHHGDVTGGCG